MIDLGIINKSELARRVGLSIVYTHQLLIGERRSPRALKLIAKYLEMPLEDLKAWIKNRRQADAPPARQPRAKKSRQDRHSPARNVSKSTR